MESRERYVIGAICIPCLIGGVFLLDSHPIWAYALFATAGVSLIWGIWPLFFKVSQVSRSTKTTPEHSVELTDADKSKITALMKSVNALDDKMNRFYNESLYHDGDRVTYYQSLLDSPEFMDLWDKYSSQRASISVVSPELSDRVNDLLLFVQSHHRYLLQEWRESQSAILKKKFEEQLEAIEIIRKGIKETIEKLIGQG